MCLAPNSYCDLASNRCKCKTNYVPAWGGEACVSEAYETDTCDLASGSLSTCGPPPPNMACFGSPNPAFKTGTGTCSCAANERLDFVMLHGHTSFWYGPHCRRSKYWNNMSTCDFAMFLCSLSRRSQIPVCQEVFAVEVQRAD